MSNKRRWPLIGAGVPLGLFLLLVAAWGVDSLVSGDHVVRNVVAGSTDLGGLSEADVVNAGADLTTRLSSESLSISIDGVDVSTDPVSVGTTIDGERLAADAMAARRGGFFLLRPIRWVGTFFSDESIEVHYLHDSQEADQATVDLINPLLDKPTNPKLALVEDDVIALAGTDGSIVEPGTLSAAMPAAIKSGPPYAATLQAVPLPPKVDSDALGSVAEAANLATSLPVLIQVLNAEAEVSVAQLRSMIVLDDSSEFPDWSIDPDLASAALQPLFPGLGNEGQLARFDIVDNIPIVIPASESVVCCDDQTSELLKAGLVSSVGFDSPLVSDGEDGEIDPELTTIQLEPMITDSAEGVAELQALGIVEEIATFTTKHACCENRVTNIQLMAEIVKGTIIRPGESFDLNQIVGKRDVARGFKPAGAIASGNLEQQVGGGVSQFTTTIFNAAFFGGLDIDEYQSHSLYFSRYPKGREATISWPKPDFIVTNPTDYGILVWPTWTDNSITVTLYSTKNIDVFCVTSDGSLVTGPKECDKSITASSQGKCTRWTTKRERVFANGDVVDDKVFAVYRPGAGLDCAGNSTVPTTTTTTNPDSPSTSDGDTTTTAGSDTTTTTVAEPVTTTVTTTATTDP